MCRARASCDAFGWQVMQVLAKDWLHAPEAVLEQIESGS
jgi:hypothetical protein